MSSTRPSTSSKRIRSPIRIGGETASRTPATMLAIVCWAAKPMIAASTAVEARMRVARRLNSVNWLSAIATRTRKTTKNSSRRRKRRRVRVDRETCLTAGVMDGKLDGEEGGGSSERGNSMEARSEEPPTSLPYASWGPQLAIGGVFLALGAGILLGIPAVIVDSPSEGDLSSAANAVVQLATALGFLLVPIAIASRWGESS